MQKIIETIKNVWHNENYTEGQRIIIITGGILLAFAIAFGIYCLVGLVMWALYSKIASVCNWPTFNYWFFVVGSFAVRIIIKFFSRKKGQ